MLTDEQIFDILDEHASAETLQTHHDLMLNSLVYQQYFKELEAIHLDLADMPLEHTSANFTENVLAAIPAEKPVLVLVKHRVWSSRLVYVFFGVMLAIVLAVTSLMIFSQPTDVTKIQQPNPVFKYITTFLLQDFSKIAILLNLLVILVIFDKKVLRPYFKHRKMTLG